MICLGRLCFHGDCAHSVVSWLPLGCAVPMACSHPGPWPTAPCLPASWSHKAVSVCSRRTAAPHHARLVNATSGWSALWLTEQTKRETVDITDTKYAVSMLPVSFTQLHLIMHQTQHQDEENKMLYWTVSSPKSQKKNKKHFLQIESPKGVSTFPIESFKLLINPINKTFYPCL